jgi:hypothetical protein
MLKAVPPRRAVQCFEYWCGRQISWIVVGDVLRLIKGQLVLGPGSYGPDHTVNGGPILRVDVAVRSF